MRGSQNEQLKLEIKKLIIETCHKKILPESLPDDVEILGSESLLGLDSLDVLELSLVLKTRFGVRIVDSKNALMVMKSINSLADFIEPA